MCTARFVACVLLSGAVSFAALEAIATASEVRDLRGTATLVDTQGERAVAIGDQVEAGALLTTGADSILQIIFDAETRLAADEGASVKIAALEFTDTGQAKKIDIEAYKGAFRFSSDDSSDKELTIRTASATLALRGTAFDFTVTPSGGTRLLLLEGEVEMCGTGENAECRTVATPCAMLRTDDGKRVEQVAHRAPGTPGEEGAAAAQGADPDAPTVEDEIRDNFPYQHTQDELLEELQIAGRSCLTTGGLADKPLGGPLQVKPAAVAIGTAVAVTIGCLLFCRGRQDSNTRTNE